MEIVQKELAHHKQRGDNTAAEDASMALLGQVDEILSLTDLCAPSSAVSHASFL